MPFEEWFQVALSLRCAITSRTTDAWCADKNPSTIQTECAGTATQKCLVDCERVQGAGLGCPNLVWTLFSFVNSASQASCLKASFLRPRLLLTGSPYRCTDNRTQSTKHSVRTANRVAVPLDTQLLVIQQPCLDPASKRGLASGASPFRSTSRNESII